MVAHGLLSMGHYDMFSGISASLCQCLSLVFVMKDNAYIACIRLGLHDLHSTELDFFLLSRYWWLLASLISFCLKEHKTLVIVVTWM